MNILVTGAAGFVGSALYHDLDGVSGNVVGLIRDWHGEPRDYGRTIVFGDVTDRALCSRILADYEIDTVYHLAAQSIVRHCAEDPVTALNVAVMGTANLLQAVREAGRPIRTVVSTSDKVYGHAPSPYDEQTAFDPRHAYETSKACQDFVARMFFHNYGVDVRVVRAVNIYGPGDPNESRIVPQTAMRILRGDPPLLHEGAASMRRQYVYIDDMVSALRIVNERGTPGGVYCIGSTDPPMTVLEVMQAMAKCAGCEWTQPEVKARDDHFHEIKVQSVVDTKLRDLGWRPEVSIEDGIKRTIEWYRARDRRQKLP